MGSGLYLRNAIKKHGIDNFIKEYLFIFDNKEDMDNKEKEIVNESFILEDTNYNLKLGGTDGGWDYVHMHNLTDVTNARKVWDHKYHNDDNFKELIHSNGTKALKLGRIALDLKYPNGTFYCKSHSEETKLQMSKSNTHQKGSNNSQYGTIWIHSLELKVSKRINKNDNIPEGWYKGRKIKF